MQSAMNDPKQQNQDAAANWRALQAELGLVADGPESMTPEAPRTATRQEQASKTAEPKPPASMWESDSAHGGEPLPKESPFIEGSIPVHAEAAEMPLGDEPEAVSPDADREVEVGEAPEEVPDAEPEAEEEKPRRRRRGRRRRRSDGGPREEVAEERETGEEPAADEDQGDEDAGEEDEDEAEVERFADWSVPSWQELIGSLYRPER